MIQGLKNLDFTKLQEGIEINITDFAAVMKNIGISCKITFSFDSASMFAAVPAAPGPVQVPLNPQPVTPERAAAAATTPSPAPKKKKVNLQCRPGMLIKCPHCERSMDRRSLHGHIKHGHRDLYKKDEVTRYIKGEPAAAAAGPAPAIALQGIDQDLLQALPEVRPSTHAETRAYRKELAPGPAEGPADEIKRTMHVKTTQLYEGISPDMIGVVQKRAGKKAEVNFGKSGYRTIPVECLVAV